MLTYVNQTKGAKCAACRTGIKEGEIATASREDNVVVFRHAECTPAGDGGQAGQRLMDDLKGELLDTIRGQVSSLHLRCRELDV